jgi:hypothetical protein
MQTGSGGFPPENAQVRYCLRGATDARHHGKSTMSMKITYPDGTTEIIPEAIRVDQQNFHEGMYDFYDERGNLLRQIDMHSGIKWEIDDDSDE